MATAMQYSQDPSTPSSSAKPSKLFGKVFNKLRTPSGDDSPSGSGAHGNDQHTPRRAFSPMLGRRSSSKSSLRVFGGGAPLTSLSANSSTSSLAGAGNGSILGFEEDDLDLPQFESDMYSPWDPAPPSRSSPYSRNLPSTSTLNSSSSLASAAAEERPFSGLTAQPAPSRPGTSLSMRSRSDAVTEEGSGGSGWKSALRSRKASGAGSDAAATKDSAGSLNRSLGRTWTKGKEAMARSLGKSGGVVTATPDLSEAERTDDEELTHKVPNRPPTPPIEEFKQPPPPPSLASSARAPLNRLASNDRLLSSSQPASLDTSTTPGVPRAGLSKSTASSTAAGAASTATSVGRKNWLTTRGASSHTGGAVTGKARRVVQRAPPPESQMLVQEETEAEGSQFASQGQSQPSPGLAAQARPSPPGRPSLSPSGHGRSRSEIPPASPKLVQPVERGAATVTLNSSSYLRKHALADSAYNPARPGSSLGHYSGSDNTSDSSPHGGLPSSSNAASAAASATFARMRAQQPLGSTAFRNRFLNSASSASLSSGSATNSPDLPSFSSSSGPTPSPPNLLSQATSQPARGPVKLAPMGSTLSRKNSVSMLASTKDDSPPAARAASLDIRRAHAAERATAQLAESRASLDETRRSPPAQDGSEMMIPYASRRGSISRAAGDVSYEQHQPTITSGSSTLIGSLNSSHKRNSETLLGGLSGSMQPHQPAAPRPGSSMSMYRDESKPVVQTQSRMVEPIAEHHAPSQPYHQPIQQPPRPRSAQAVHPYQDENAYDPRTAPPSYAHHAPPAHPAPPPPPQMVHQQPLSYPHSTLTNGRQVLAEVNRDHPPSTVQQQQREYAKSQQHPHEYQVPLRDRSPGMAEATPSVTAQQHHYQSQQVYQHQQQQQMMMQGYPGQTPGTEQPADQVKRVPKVITVNGKPYHRAGILGRGGSSKVYRVLAPSSELYALKKVDTRNDAESRASFINEITLLRKLAGKPEIIQLIDAEVQSKYVYMVMEAGETDLNTLIASYSGRPISLNFIRYIWEQMLSAVQVIHEESIVHSDLKPANFVLVKGRVKLIDFGISKAIAADTTNIGRDQQIGTANYMPPEALLDTGLGHDGKRLMKLGRPADVWELGCILYQLVYGAAPFAHIRDISQKIMMIQNPLHRINYPSWAVPIGKRGEDLTEFKVKVGPDILETMKSCLRYYPKERATIPELLQQPFLRRAGDEPPPPPPTAYPTVNEQEMQLLTMRIAFMLGGQAGMDRLLRNPAENADVAQKLMKELRDLKPRQ
ncbi:hypothetical protein JCM1841_004667 [Sporobolomyces salmonicolor]